MVILKEGEVKILELINTNLTQGQNGTGTSTATENDTGLDIAAGATLKTLSKSISENLLTASYVLNTTDGNGLSFTEFENLFSSGESLIRIRHTPLTKDNTKELTFIITYAIEGT